MTAKTSLFGSDCISRAALRTERHWILEKSAPSPEGTLAASFQAGSSRIAVPSRLSQTEQPKALCAAGLAPESNNAKRATDTTLLFETILLLLSN
jgi:hypothetical protein